MCNNCDVNKDSNSVYCKIFLKGEVERWIYEHNGNIPGKDDMKKREGYPNFKMYSKHLNLKTWNSILTELGFTLNNKFWTIDEVEFLQENFEVLSDIEISIKLGRSKDAISYKRKEIKLFRQKQKQFWTEAEKNFLIDNFYLMNKEEICKYLYNRNWETISSYARKTLKLKRKHRLYISKRRSKKRV